ncbi:hypothetical protein SmJEL517_g02864 [Synchytrium microbalum]|uniref:30S ribosomal protein S17 n=1 Tax=Synchytrium microbalum TaxID=1806994 RepID=A0A507C5Y0_9FUNG|nr:uncharacterized protein SmJEL517_g02864 [Synchytrium microbalum]TPX34509.1 hypothetical protein SmJEL517_g02864 [Synchytrium microbalum]
MAATITAKRIGEVIRANMDKTVKVRFAKTKMHPIVLKPVTTHKNILAHDETNKCVVGDIVRIESCPQISSTKKFTVTEIVKPAVRVVDPDHPGRVISQRADEAWNRIDA